MASQSVLVTGASGFVGARMVEVLLAAGHRVIASCRSNRHGLTASDRLRVLETDLAELRALPKIDAIVHCAALTQVAEATAARFVRDNIVATERLTTLAAAAGVPRFIFLSSISVHGEIDGAVVDDATPMVNPNAYGVSKIIGEQLVTEYAGSGRGAVSLRLPSIIGPGASRIWLSRVRDLVLAGQPVQIRNAAAPFNNALHINDLATFAAQLLGQNLTGHHAMPLASAGSVGIADVVRLMMAGVGRTVPVVDLGPGGPSFVISNDKASQLFGYAPRNIADVVLDYASSR